MSDDHTPSDRASLLHEARQALTAAIARVQLVRRRLEQAAADLAHAEGEVKRLTALIDRLEDETNAGTRQRPR